MIYSYTDIAKKRDKYPMFFKINRWKKGYPNIGSSFISLYEFTAGRKLMDPHGMAIFFGHNIPIDIETAKKQLLTWPYFIKH
jgi:hypothetical protein